VKCRDTVRHSSGHRGRATDIYESDNEDYSSGALCRSNPLADNRRCLVHHTETCDTLVLLSEPENLNHFLSDGDVTLPTQHGDIVLTAPPSDLPPSSASLEVDSNVDENRFQVDDETKNIDCHRSWNASLTRRRSNRGTSLPPLVDNRVYSPSSTSSETSTSVGDKFLSPRTGRLLHTADDVINCVTDRGHCVNSELNW